MTKKNRNPFAISSKKKKGGPMKDKRTKRSKNKEKKIIEEATN